MSPYEILMDFLKYLPNTIRDSIHGVLYVHMFGVTIEEDTTESLVARLNKLEKSRSISAIILSAGVIDYIFARDDLPGWAEQLEDLAKETGSDLFNRQALSEPLQVRHRMAARERWNELRATSLSHRAIHEYELERGCRILKTRPTI